MNDLRHHKDVRWSVASTACVFATCVSTMFLAVAQTPVSTTPDATEIVRRSVQHDLLNFERLKDYTYTEHDEERSYDKQGRVQKTESQTYEVMIFGGRDYEKLVARDGKPLSEKDARKEQEKMDKEFARREHESAEDKAKLEKQRLKDRAFLNEVPQAFHFKLLGEEPVSGKPAWVIFADPIADYHAKDRRAKLLTKLRGKIWIDKGEYQWVKIEVQAAAPMSFGLGLLRIEPGATIRFEQTRVNDEVWLPASASIRVDGRVAFFKKIHGDVELRFRDYQKFQSDSTFVAGPAANQPPAADQPLNDGAAKAPPR